MNGSCGCHAKILSPVIFETSQPGWNTFALRFDSRRLRQTIQDESKRFDKFPLKKQGGVNLIAPHRSTRKLKAQDGHHLRRHQRCRLVAQFCAWLQWKRRLLVRWKYYAANLLGFVQHASITMLLKQF